jgi:hypothetical protein
MPSAPVIENGKLVGTVSRADVCRAVVSRKALSLCANRAQLWQARHRGTPGAVSMRSSPFFSELQSAVKT